MVIETYVFQTGKRWVGKFQSTLLKRTQYTYESAIKKSGVRAWLKRVAVYSFLDNLFSIRWPLLINAIMPALFND